MSSHNSNGKLPRDANPTQEVCCGVDLPCPKCGDGDAEISLGLHDEKLTCAGCGERFTADYIREFISNWQPVLAWMDAFPRSRAK